MSDFILNEFLPYRLSVLADNISRDFSELYRRKFGIAVSEWRVIAHLSQTEGPVSVREIYRRVKMDKSKVSRAASRLETLGFLTKTKNRTDGRLIELTLSKKGRELVREMAPVATEFEREFLARLGGLEEAFLDGLDTLLDENSAEN